MIQLGSIQHRRQILNHFVFFFRLRAIGEKEFLAQFRPFFLLPEVSSLSFIEPRILQPVKGFASRGLIGLFCRGVVVHLVDGTYERHKRLRLTRRRPRTVQVSACYRRQTIMGTKSVFEDWTEVL